MNTFIVGFFIITAILLSILVISTKLLKSEGRIISKIKELERGMILMEKVIKNLIERK